MRGLQLLTKSITAMIMNAIGDIVCQTVVEKGEKVDLARLLKCSLMGRLYVGPVLHLWYGWLASVAPAGMTGKQCTGSG